MCYIAGYVGKTPVQEESLRDHSLLLPVTVMRPRTLCRNSWKGGMSKIVSRAGAACTHLADMLAIGPQYGNMSSHSTNRSVAPAPGEYHDEYDFVKTGGTKPEELIRLQDALR